MKLQEITQRMLETYEDGLVEVRESDAFNTMSVTHFNRIIIECATKASIATDLPDDLGDCKPSEITAWTIEISKHVLEAKAPPDPN